MLLLAFTTSTRASGFMAAFEEIPLMQGMLEEQPFSFDTEEARIIEQYVSSSEVSKDEFAQFYSETLRSLGWNLATRNADAIVFRRENETLSLMFESESPLVVLFSLKPTGR